MNKVRIGGTRERATGDAYAEENLSVEAKTAEYGRILLFLGDLAKKRVTNVNSKNIIYSYH